MKSIIAVNLTEQETNIVAGYKAAIARDDGSADSALLPLKGKACRFNDNAWEMMLAVASEAATELLTMSHSRFPNSEALAKGVVAPLTAFASSMKDSPDAWLASNSEGAPVDALVAGGFLKTLHLLQGNPRLRIDLLERCNGRIEVSVESGGMKVVLDSTISNYTLKPLKPLSKRDLTAQIGNALMFLSKNPGGFTIH